MRRTLIIDTETTGLDPARRGIWEVALIDRPTGAEHVWRVEPDLSVADPEALAIGRFAERTAGMRHATPDEVSERYGPRAGSVTRRTDVWDLARVRSRDCHWSDPADLAGVLVEYFLRDAILVAANPAFDAGFLSAFLARHGQPPRPWHYRLRDIGAMAIGYLCRVATEPPLIDASTDELAEALGVDPGQFERHSALGDCRLVNAMLGVIEGGRL